VCADRSKLVSALNCHLAYMPAATTPSSHIVFFRDAIEHIFRLDRILHQTGGHAMLLGVGGSGKQTLARFAAAASGCSLCTFGSSPTYTHKDFREDLKVVFESAGVDGHRLCLLLTDVQLPSAQFLEDVSSLLNTGDVMQLFSENECTAIFARLQPWFAEHDVVNSRHAMYKAFVQRVWGNIHLVLALSPSGVHFSENCKQFPSLVNCCTIDWYAPWPEAALTAIATKVLNGGDVGSSEVVSAVTKVATAVHASVGVAAEQLDRELNRKVYTTPQSYVYLLALFMHLVKKTRAQLSNDRNRMLVGLEKLRQTEVVVAEMEQELHALKPVLKQKTSMTAELLKHVAEEQAGAEKIKSMVALEEAEVKARTKETQVRLPALLIRSPCSPRNSTG
jgi:dynein heavy chain, axonemal